MEIARGELLDSERVDEGDDVCEVMVEVEGDLTISRSNPKERPPPLIHDDICIYVYVCVYIERAQNPKP